MPGYRAAAGGGLFGSSAYPDSRPRIDVGGALDSLGHTAESLISQAYQRKVGQQQFELQQNAQQLERERAANEQTYRTQTLALDKQRADREHDLAVAGLAERGFVPDDDAGGSLTASVYGAPPSAAPASGSAIGASPAPYASLTQRAFNAPQLNPGGPGSIALAPPESAAASMNAPSAPAMAPVSNATPAAHAPGTRVVIGGKQYRYDYSQSAAGRGEQTRETFEKGQKATDQAFGREMEKAKAGDERALENLKYMHEQGLIPIKAKAEADAFLSKQQFGTPNQDETTAATQLPEMVKAHQILQDLGKPDLITSLTKKYGTLGKALQSAEGQRYLQAAKQFSITGTLATEGARYNPDKQKASDDMFLPTATTDPTVVTQMQKSREQRMRDAAMKSGRAFNNLPLDTQQYLTDSLGYKPIRGQTPPPPAAAAVAPPSAPVRRVGPGATPAASGDINLGAPVSAPVSAAPRRLVNPQQIAQQRADYDAAAAHLKAQGKTDAAIATELGARP